MDGPLHFYHIAGQIAAVTTHEFSEEEITGMADNEVAEIIAIRGDLMLAANATDHVVLNLSHDPDPALAGANYQNLIRDADAFWFMHKASTVYAAGAGTSGFLSEHTWEWMPSGLYLKGRFSCSKWQSGATGHYAVHIWYRVVKVADATLVNMIARRGFR